MRENKKKITGTVISDKMDKTRVVAGSRTFRHSVYQKVMRRVKKYYCHDEKNETHVGDKVRIIESRPLSKLKRWVIIEKI
jgi:small subunit ribosomal protein S17